MTMRYSLRRLLSFSTASSRSANLCSVQSCLKFLRFLECFKIKNAQNVKDLGLVIRNCKHLKTIELVECGDGVCELLDQVPNLSSCSLRLCGEDCFDLIDLDPGCCTLRLVEAEKLAGVLPRFNITVLHLALDDCYDAAVKRRTLAALGQSLSEMSSLKELALIWLNEDILQAEELEVLFGGIKHLSFAWGSLAPPTKCFQFFPNLLHVRLEGLNVDEYDLRGLLESLTSCPNLKSLDLGGSPLGFLGQGRIYCETSTASG